jgi:hypothetical protein
MAEALRAPSGHAESCKFPEALSDEAVAADDTHQAMIGWAHKCL